MSKGQERKHETTDEAVKTTDEAAITEELEDLTVPESDMPSIVGGLDGRQPPPGA